MYLLNTERGDRHLKGLSCNIDGGIENYQSINHYLKLQCEFHKWQVDRQLWGQIKEPNKEYIKSTYEV